MLAKENHNAGLTRRQSDLLEYIKSCSKTPSYEEMMKGMGLKSKSNIHALILSLEERGYIHRIPGRARVLTVKNKTLDGFSTAELRAEIARRNSLKKGEA